MFPRFLPATIVMAIVAFAVSGMSAGFMLREPRLWSAAVALVVLGAITPMIYAVNIRIIPVFSRRRWQSSAMLIAAIALGVAGAWITWLARFQSIDALETAGAASALAGGLLFVASLIRLFRSPVVTQAGPPLPYPEHAIIDQMAIRFTRIAGMYLLAGLAVGFVLSLWTPARGRWDLVWAHLLLLGWFLHMASGVVYHVLARWTGAHWRTPSLIAMHLRISLIALPVLLTALALNIDWLLAAGGVLQAIALTLLAINVLPMTVILPVLPRLGFTAAVLFLLAGVLLGASFAVDPVIGARLRITHASLNLFGWSGLLVCGAGYYLFPHFAGQPLRWPRLGGVQLAAQVSGVVLLAGGWWWQQYGGPHANGEPFMLLGGTAIGASVLLFAAIIAATFVRRDQRIAAPVTLVRPGAGMAKR